jgi:hypothetical protein
LSDAAAPWRTIDYAGVRCAGQSEEVIVKSNHDAVLGKGKVQMLFVGSAEQSGLLRGRDIDAPKAQAIGHNAVDVFIEMKADTDALSSWLLRKNRLNTCPEIIGEIFRFFYLSINFCAMIVVISQGRMYVGQRKLGKIRYYFLGRSALFGPDDDVGDANSSPHNSRLAATDAWR